MKYGLALQIIIILLLITDLLGISYEYSQCIRYLLMIGFAVLAYLNYIKGSKTSYITFLCLALLFQPVIVIPLGTLLWNALYLIVVIGMFVSVIKSKS